jgi:hypothetical protein
MGALEAVEADQAACPAKEQEEYHPSSGANPADSCLASSGDTEKAAGRCLRSGQPPGECLLFERRHRLDFPAMM